MHRNDAGFTLLELMITSTILVVLVTFMAASTAMFFRQQTSSAREARETSASRASLTVLQADVMYAGFGEPLTVQAVTGVNNGGLNGSDTLRLTGRPLGGPHLAQWTHTLSDTSSTPSDQATVRCYGMQAGTQRFPAPQTDITGASGTNPLAVKVTNFAGQELFSQPLNVIAISPECTMGPDIDSDGLADWQMTLTFDRVVGLRPAAIITVAHPFAGATGSEVTYAVDADRRLVRTVPGLPPEPLLTNVEDFQVRYGWSATDGTFQGWSDAPVWDPALRTTAIRVNITTADPRREDFATWNQFTSFDHTYTVQAGSEKWARLQIERIFETPNARFSHP